MIIKDAQLDAFLPQTDEETVTFIVAHLEEESPELIDRIPPDGLREMVESGVARARSHKLSALGNLTAFVSLMFEIAPNFDEQPQISEVLRDENVPIEKNFDRLFQPALDDAWEQAAANYDPDAWAEAWHPELRDDKE